MKLLSTGAPFIVTAARPDQTVAVFSLLPELLAAPALPPNFIVAHLEGQPSRIIGAAACAPAMHVARTPGFRGQCRVLDAFRRQGVGRALVTQLAADVAAWDVPHLLSWDAVPEGPSTAFLRTLGFRVNFSLHRFVGESATMGPICRRMMQALAARSRVPPEVRLLPLGEAPLEPILALHCGQFHADLPAARALFESALAQPLSRRLSLALWDGKRVLGYALAGQESDMPTLRYWATDPAHRSGWPAILLLDGYTRRVEACGLHRSRFVANGDSPAPMNIARRIGARRESVDEGWVLDLSASRR